MIFVWTCRRINNDVHLRHPSIAAEFMWMLCSIWCLCGVWDYVWAMFELGGVWTMLRLCLCHDWVLCELLCDICVMFESYVSYCVIFVSYLCQNYHMWIIVWFMCKMQGFLQKQQKSVTLWSLCRDKEHGKGLCRGPAHGKAHTWRPPVLLACLLWTIWSICRVGLVQAHGKEPRQASSTTVMCRGSSGKDHGKDIVFAVGLRPRITAKIQTSPCGQGETHGNVLNFAVRLGWYARQTRWTMPCVWGDTHGKEVVAVWPSSDIFWHIHCAVE